MTYKIFPKELKFILKKLENEIEKLPIPIKDSRKDTAGIGRSIVFGLTKHRRVSELQISAYTLKYPLIYKLLDIVASYLDFDFTSIMVNRNYECKPHIDKNKYGTLNMIYGFGDYEGGELVYDGKEYDIKNKFLIFDGKKIHSVKPFIGTRHTLTWFSK